MAIEQLASDKLEIRLGGIYALERISLDSEKDHWPIMEVLTAFLRNNAIKSKYEIDKEKHSIFWTPPDIQAIITVISGRTRGFGKGENRRLNLMRTYLPGAIFNSAELEEALFVGSNLEEASFSKANLKNANFLFADLKNAYLQNANLDGTVLNEADLQDADLRGAIGLTKEQIKSANINENTKLPDYLRKHC